MLKSLKFGGVSRVKNPRVSKTPVDHVSQIHDRRLIRLFSKSAFTYSLRPCLVMIVIRGNSSKVRGRSLEWA